MRTAILSDVHGNLTALEAVAADLRETAPDRVLHGGDLADSGASPVEVVDLIRDAGWEGVAGNTDELLFDPNAFGRFYRASHGLWPMIAALKDMAEWSRALLGEERLAWLAALPRSWRDDRLTLVHASPDDPWSGANADASDDELTTLYGDLGTRVVVYGHIHVPFIRALPSGIVVANSGSVGLPYDGDRRASYLIVDGGDAQIRRVEYDVEGEIARLRASSLPHGEWTIRTLETAQPEVFGE